MPVLALLVFALIASMGYYLIEKDYTWWDCVYMTIITISTVGYREVHPLSHAGKLWTMFVIAGGLVAGTVVLGLVAAMIVEGRIRTVFGRRKLERKINNLNGHVIVCGYGDMGAAVTQELLAAGREVVVVDSSPVRTEAAEAAGVLYVLGDAQSEQALEAAGLARAVALISVLASDAENVFVTLTARQMNRDVTIVAKARNTSTQDKLQTAGATRVICPQMIGASRMVDVVLRPAVVDFVEVAHKGVALELDQLQLAEQSSLVGKALRELALPRRLGVQVVAVRPRDGQTVYHPTAEYELHAGDTLILIGPRGVASAVQKLQEESAQS